MESATAHQLPPTTPLRMQLNFQITVNRLILEQRLRPSGQGGLVTEAEMAEMERSCDAGETPESFVARVIAPKPAVQVFSFHQGQRRIAQALDAAGVEHQVVTIPIRHREVDR